MSADIEALATNSMPRPRKTAILLAQRIVGEITDSSLAPGASLPSERQMLETLGVARGTLREALRFLELQGVVRMRPGPGGGPTVREVEPTPLASVIALLLQLSNAPFSTILDARQVLEPAIAALAAERASPADVEALQASVDSMAEALEDLPTFFAENHTFHEIIARASKNALFELLLASLSSIASSSSLGVQYDRRRRREILETHQQIHDAIEAHDAATAQELMAQHMREFREFVKRKYAHVLNTPLRWDRMEL